MIYLKKPDIKYIVIHHTAVSRSVQPLQKESVNSYHRSKWGMVSELGFYGGYNFIVEPTGERTQYRKIGEETIAQVGMNCDVPSRCGAISYCMAGDFRVEKPTDLQVNDFKDFYLEVRKKYPKVQVVQHKDVQAGRTCAYLTSVDMEILTEKENLSDTISRQKKIIKKLKLLIALLIKLRNK